MNRLDEPPRPFPPVLLQTPDPIGSEVLIGFHVDRPIDHDNGPHRIGPDLVSTNEDFLRGDRPACDHGWITAQVLKQFADVAPPTRRVIAVRRLLGATLPAGVQGNHAVR